MTVSLTTDIESEQGLPMDTSYVWSFTAAVGAGTGKFVEYYVYATGTLPRAVQAADLDGDGDVDLAVANRNTHNVSVLLNNGDGTYAAHTTYSVTSYPINLFAADLNGDGRPDLVSTSSSGNNVSVLINNGNGTFATHVDYAVGSTPYSVSGGDLDGDGDVDVVTGNQSNVSVLRNNGNGTFAARVNYTGGAFVNGLSLFDSDGDGDLDVACANSNDDTVTLLVNDGFGFLTLLQTYPVGDNPSKIVGCDLDADGDNDMAVANRNSHTVGVLKNNGNGTFAAQVTYAVGTNPVSVFAADLDADGDLDLASANYSSNDVAVLLNGGAGVFSYGGDYGVQTGPYDLFAADVNGDRALDLAVINLNTNNLSILLNTDMVCATLPITATGVDIPFVAGTDTLAILNFASEALDSLTVCACLDQVPPNIPAGTDWVRRYYVVTPYPASAVFYADFTLFYGQAEFDASGLFDEQLLHAWRYDETGSEWEYQPGITDTDENSIHCTAVTGFSIWGITVSASIVAINENVIPKASALYQNYPNPFNPVTHLSYQLHRDSKVKLTVYDVLGREVVTLVDGYQEWGYKAVTWDGRDGAGRNVASGVYFYRLIAGDFVQTRKMVLLR